MDNGREGECSCTEHSTPRAQLPMLRIESPRIITGLCIDLRRENPLSFMVMRWRTPWARGSPLGSPSPVARLTHLDFAFTG